MVEEVEAPLEIDEASGVELEVSETDSDIIEVSVTTKSKGPPSTSESASPTLWAATTSKLAQAKASFVRTGSDLGLIRSSSSTSVSSTSSSIPVVFYGCDFNCFIFETKYVYFFRLGMYLFYKNFR